MENKELITKAIAYAKHNAGNADITVQDVATGAGFSIDYFNRIFLAHTGFTVMSYINYTRLKEASRLLRTTDHSIGARFVHEHPEFQLLDTNTIIDYLLEKDAKRYGYFCANIKYMGLAIAAPAENHEQGFIGIGDNRNGESYLELMTDDSKLLTDWLRRFSNVRTFRFTQNPEAMQNILNSRQINLSLESTPESLFLGAPVPYTLPESIIIRPLTAADINTIRTWAYQNSDVKIDHLLNKTYYSFESSLDYGVFENDMLIAIAECGIDEVHGLKMNDSCRIHFMKDKASDTMYRKIYAYITNDLLNRGVLPFDDIQHGEYAKSHGNFTATELGFEIMNWRYTFNI